MRVGEQGKESGEFAKLNKKRDAGHRKRILMVKKLKELSLSR